MVDDKGLIGSKNETKLFYVSFESFGKGACLLIDYHDGIKRSYGDKHFCNVEWNRPGYKYIDGVELKNPMVINYVYS